MDEIKYCYIMLLIEFVLMLLVVSTNLEEKKNPLEEDEHPILKGCRISLGENIQSEDNKPRIGYHGNGHQHR